MDPLVPLLIPEVNPDHLALLDDQRRARGLEGTGGIVTNPNCSAINIAVVLAGLRQFQPTRVIITTLQALSGAGYPGVASLDALGNVIPYIGGAEEEKIETETRKLLGTYERGSGIRNAGFVVSATTTRVPVADGHTAVMSIELAAKPSIDDVTAALASFTAEPQQRNLPLAPHPPIVVHGAGSSQPRLDVHHGRGMTVHVGRVLAVPDPRHKLVAAGHNLVRGAAGAALLNAELIVARQRSGSGAHPDGHPPAVAAAAEVHPQKA
jgi:aspartate-semialdehyde dehydrogenase